MYSSEFCMKQHKYKEIWYSPRVLASFALTPQRLAEITAAEAQSTDNPKRRQNLAAYLSGKVLKKTGGCADPKIVREQIEKLLGQ